MNRKRIEVGKRYTNRHTGESCVVTGKIFFNIQYYDDDDPHRTHAKYCHYKRFQKNWREEGRWTYRSATNIGLVGKRRVGIYHIEQLAI